MLTLQLSLFPRFDRYLFQFKSSSSITPKYLTWFVGFIFWPLSRKLRCLVIILFFVLNIIISVLLAFKESLFALTHSEVEQNTELYWTARWRSLMNKIKSRGPKTDPCGISPFNCLMLDWLLLLAIVNCILYLQVRMKPVIFMPLLQ